MNLNFFSGKHFFCANPSTASPQSTPLLWGGEKEVICKIGNLTTLLAKKETCLMEHHWSTLFGKAPEFCAHLNLGVSLHWNALNGRLQMIENETPLRSDNVHLTIPPRRVGRRLRFRKRIGSVGSEWRLSVVVVASLLEMHRDRKWSCLGSFLRIRSSFTLVLIVLLLKLCC